MQAELTGRQLARKSKISQSTVSRIELGQAIPSVTDVEAWAIATEASEEERAELVEWAEQVGTEATNRRKGLRRGLPRLQWDVKELEATARTIRNFQPVFVPGLLQTADYARRLYAAGYPADRPDVAPAIAARMDRQTILYDDSKQLEFIIAEPALRWSFGPPNLMLAQLDRILTVATLSNITLGILPQASELTPWHAHGFNVFDDRGDEDPVVHFETLTTDLTIRDADDVAVYRDAFEVLRWAALFGDEARALLREIMTSLSRTSPRHADDSER